VHVATVETVRGPVDLDDLGRTLMHEHVFIMQPEALQNWGHRFGPSYSGTRRSG
jgi:phosphotriesterase-related protein